MEQITTPFLENAKKNIGCAPMSDGAAQEYAMSVMMESNGEKVVTLEDLREENIFVIEAILKRITVLNLPIEFTPEGLIAAYAFTENVVGRAMLLLIDCLTLFEGKKVNANMLADVYPFGFYNEETSEDYINNYLKNKDIRDNIKWAGIY